MADTVSHKAALVTARIEEIRKASPLAAAQVTLVAASKNQPEIKLREAIASGVRVFGENKVQEAESKWPGLRREFPGLRLHLIGPLQSNKARDAVELFDVIETLDRPSLAETLAKEIARAGKAPELLIQVNTGEEKQKSGIAPKEADNFIAYAIKELKLPVTGLMCVPPVDDIPAPHFALLREIALRHGLSNLSMGMSGDFETAIRFGATEVRIGTALFGERVV